MWLSTAGISSRLNDYAPCCCCSKRCLRIAHFYSQSVHVSPPCHVTALRTEACQPGSRAYSTSTVCYETLPLFILSSGCHRCQLWLGLKASIGGSRRGITRVPLFLWWPGTKARACLSWWQYSARSLQWHGLVNMLMIHGTEREGDQNSFWTTSSL